LLFISLLLGFVALRLIQMNYYFHDQGGQGGEAYRSFDCSAVWLPSRSTPLFFCILKTVSGYSLGSDLDSRSLVWIHPRHLNELQFQLLGFKITNIGYRIKKKIIFSKKFLIVGRQQFMNLLLIFIKIFFDGMKLYSVKN
jgi:hypothetical protein